MNMMCIITKELMSCKLLIEVFDGRQDEATKNRSECTSLSIKGQRISYLNPPIEVI